MSTGRSGKRVSINDIVLPPNFVKNLSGETLNTLSSQDEGTFYEYFQGLELDEVKKVRERRQVILEKNRELAVANTELEPRFEETKAELRRKCTQVADLKEEYQKKYTELKAFQDRSNPTALKKQLQESAKKSEETSENLAADFIAGKSELPLEEFKEEFIKQRSLYWSRKVKAEKIDEILKNRMPVPAPRSPRPRTNIPPTNPAQSLPTATPYPPNQSRRMPDPVASLPPYSAPPPHGGSSGGMPVPRFPPPGHPFNSGYGGYGGYGASPRNVTGSYQSRPPPIPGYQYSQHRY